MNIWSNASIQDYWPLSWTDLIASLEPQGHLEDKLSLGAVFVGSPDEFTDGATAGPMIDFNPDYKERVIKMGERWNFGMSVVPKDLPQVIGDHPGFSKEFGLLKLDFDGYECHVLEEVLLAGYLPRVIVIELNSIWVPPLKFSLRYSEKWRYRSGGMEGRPFLFGCSLQYAYDLLRPYGYFMYSTQLGMDGSFMDQCCPSPSHLSQA